MEVQLNKNRWCLLPVPQSATSIMRCRLLDFKQLQQKSNYGLADAGLLGCDMKDKHIL